MDYLPQVFKALGHKRRFEIIELLLENKELSLEEIANQLKIPKNTCCRNLKVLERVHLINSKIRNGIAYYSLNRPKDHPYNTPLFNLIKFRKERRQR
jgi:predicted ArsR family transcriptional regulator